MVFNFHRAFIFLLTAIAFLNLSHSYMGHGTNQTKSAAPPPLNHFSHRHELKPIPANLNPTSTHCSGSKLPSNGVMYGCGPCRFTLHHSCANLRRRITHPSHAGCHLSLLTVPSYSTGAFLCNACSRSGDGWNYHCVRCNYDLHVACLSMPMKIRHHSHSSCDLHLTFKNPHSDSNGFKCDVCERIWSKQWLYRCDSCNFDVHLDCAAGSPPPSLQHHHSFPGTTSHHHPQIQLTHSASIGGLNYYTPPPPQQATGYGGYQYPGSVNGSNQVYGSPLQNYQPRPAGGGLGGNMMMVALQGVVGGAFQGLGQAVLQDFIGDGGGDGGGSSSYADGGGDGSSSF